ncbi:MAG: trypsin-like serine protease [Spirochaetales bacterium]|nr:trypsin-like serine protease [Spirochaetales bacterium]
MARSKTNHLGYVIAGVVIGLAGGLGFGLIPLGNGEIDLTEATNVVENGSGVRPLPELNLVGTEDLGITPLSINAGQFLTPDEQNNISVYEARNEGVVNISTETLAYSLFFEPIPQEGSSGSGSIIDSRGYILTNNHVIRSAVRVFVTLASGTRLEAEVVGVDRENDLAVLKIDPRTERLTVIPLGSTDGLRVGQKVLAIGNPFSFDRTLTTGVISGLGRPISTSTGQIINNMIQTDASINPGNSGGPLLDNQGNLIGVNTMIFTPTGGSVGVGFAVPVETAKRVIPDLIEFGRVQRGWIDIVPIQIFPQLAAFAQLPVTEGVLISQIESGGPAEAAGLRGGNPRNAVRSGNTIIYLGGDILIEIDGTRVSTLAHIFDALEDNKPGERVKVVYLRNGRQFETEVELILRPDRYM